MNYKKNYKSDPKVRWWPALPTQVLTKLILYTQINYSILKLQRRLGKLNTMITRTEKMKSTVVIKIINVKIFYKNDSITNG